MIALLPSMLLLLAGSTGAPSLAPGERWTYAITDGGASEPAVLEIVIRGGSERWTGVVRVRASEEVEVTAPPAQLLGAMAAASAFDGPRAAGPLLVAAARLDALRRGAADPWGVPNDGGVTTGDRCESSGRTGRTVKTGSKLVGGSLEACVTDDLVLPIVVTTGPRPDGPPRTLRLVERGAAPAPDSGRGPLEGLWLDREQRAGIFVRDGRIYRASRLDLGPVRAFCTAPDLVPSAWDGSALVLFEGGWRSTRWPPALRPDQQARKGVSYAWEGPGRPNHLARRKDGRSASLWRANWRYQGECPSAERRDATALRPVTPAASPDGLPAVEAFRDFAVPAPGHAERYEYEIRMVDAAGVPPPGASPIRLGVLVAPSDDGLLVLLEWGDAPRLAFRTTPSRLVRDLYLPFRSPDQPTYNRVVDGKLQFPEQPTWPEVWRLADTLAGPGLILDEVRRGFTQRWLGVAWGQGSVWMSSGANLVEVRGPCEVAGIRGVEAAVHGGEGEEHLVCAAQGLPLPLSSTGWRGPPREPGRSNPPVRSSARLVRREVLEVQDPRAATGLWQRPPTWARATGRALALRSDGTGTHLEASPGAPARKGSKASSTCGATFRWLWDGARVLELGGAQSQAHLKVLAIERVLQLEGDPGALRLREREAPRSGLGDEIFALAAGDPSKTCSSPPRPRSRTSPKGADKAPDLYDAATACDRDLTRSLLAGGADPRRPRSPRHAEPPLHAAAFCGDPAIVRALLDRGADPNHVLDGSPVLSRALTGGATEVAALLVARGARPDAMEDQGSEEAESHVVRAAWMERRDLYEALLKGGAPGGFAEVARALEAGDAAALRAALEASRGRWVADARHACGATCPVDLAEAIDAAAKR